MTPKKEHPKVIIVKIIFLFCVVRLSKSITDSLVLKRKVWKSYYQQPLVCLKILGDEFTVKIGSKCHQLRYCHQPSNQTYTHI